METARLEELKRKTGQNRMRLERMLRATRRARAELHDLLASIELSTLARVIAR